MNAYEIGGPLEVRLGSAIFPGDDAGKQLRLKRIEGDVLVRERANVWQGTLKNWLRIGVLAGSKDRARFFVLEPGGSDEEILFADFFVRGKFTVVETINNAQAARRAYDAFEPA
jgi:hypothetical protein